MVSEVVSVTLGDVSLWVIFDFTIVVVMILDLSSVLRIMLCLVRYACEEHSCSFSFTIV